MHSYGYGFCDFHAHTCGHLGLACDAVDSDNFAMCGTVIINFQVTFSNLAMCYRLHQLPGRSQQPRNVLPYASTSGFAFDDLAMLVQMIVSKLTAATLGDSPL